MSRPPGLAKTGGRERGTPNQRTLDLVEKLEKLGCDPIEGLARIAMDAATALELKVRCFTELAQYVYPKRKALAQAADPDSDSLSIEVTVTYVDSANPSSSGSGDDDSAGEDRSQ